MPNSCRPKEHRLLNNFDHGDASGFGWAASVIADLSCFFEVNGLSSTGKELRRVLEILSNEILEEAVRPRR